MNMESNSNTGAGNAAGGFESIPFTRSGERSMIPLMYGGKPARGGQPSGTRKHSNPFSWVSEAGAKSKESAAPARHRRVMVVDDDSRICSMIDRWLRRESYEVTTANSGEQAIEVVDEIKPDLLILDMHMPGMSGMTFLRKLLNWDEKPRYPVLIMTGRGELAGFFSNLDVVGFIAKPCPMKSLVKRVNEAISESSGDRAVGRSD